MEKIIKKIKSNIALEKSDIEFLFTEKVSDEQRKEFLLTLNQIGINAEHIVSFVKFLLPTNFPSADFKEAIDICGTGGSGLERINTSTISAFVLASCGLKIAKHGNRASSGRFGSFDLLEALGLQINLPAERLSEIFQQTNLAFIFAQKFFPAMRFFASVRKEIKNPTIFNLLGPLLNPAQPQIQIIGTCNLENAQKIAQSAKLLGKRKCAVLTAENGLDEVSLSDKTYVFEFDTAKDQEIKKYEITPLDFGLKTRDFNQISSKNFSQNTKLAREIMQGKCTSFHHELVLINCAFILKFLNKVDSFSHGVEIARQNINSGQPWNKFEQLASLMT